MRFPKVFLTVFILGLVSQIACAQSDPSLLKKRAGFKTELIEKKREEEVMPKPPADVPFEIVKYDTKLGKMSAYLSKPQKKEGDDKKKKTAEKGPAIIWLTGGWPPASPGAYVWEPSKISNEQSARIYRLRGITMMFPTVRGSAPGNPGYQERFLGEIDDIINAGEYLRKLPHVDPKRVYVGGHSSGGTLALLVAEATDRFAAVFAFGPADDDYGEKRATYKWTKQERELRSPIEHLGSIKVPTYVIEGEGGNRSSLVTLQAANKNKNVRFVLGKDADHFNIIHPVNSIIARAILDSKDGKLDLDVEKLSNAYVAQARRTRETSDLEALADERSRGTDLNTPKLVSFYLFASDAKAFTKEVKKQAGLAGFTYTDSEEFKNSSGKPYFGIVLTKTIDLTQLKQLFAATATVEELANQHDLHYDDWTVEKD